MLNLQLLYPGTGYYVPRGNNFSITVTLGLHCNFRTIVPRRNILSGPEHVVPGDLVFCPPPRSIQYSVPDTPNLQGYFATQAEYSSWAGIFHPECTNSSIIAGIRSYMWDQRQTSSVVTICSAAPATGTRPHVAPVLS